MMPRSMTGLIGAEVAEVPAPCTDLRPAVQSGDLAGLSAATVTGPDPSDDRTAQAWCALSSVDPAITQWPVRPVGG
jgi:hypothetical protein